MYSLIEYSAVLPRYSVEPLLLTPWVNPGSRYRCGKSTYEKPVSHGRRKRALKPAVPKRCTLAGLRVSDFRRVVWDLQEQLQSETGPYNKRPAWHVWARWVALAGGRVRGVKPAQQVLFLRGFDVLELAAHDGAGAAADAEAAKPGPGGDCVAGGVADVHDAQAQAEHDYLMQNVWPVQSRIRVPLFAARTLNATRQSRVTLSLR